MDNKYTGYRQGNIVKAHLLLGDYWMQIVAIEENKVQVLLTSILAGHQAPIKVAIEDLERIEIDAEIIRHNGAQFRTLFRFFSDSDSNKQKVRYTEHLKPIIEIKGLKDMLDKGKSFYLDALQNYLEDNLQMREVDISSITDKLL